MNKNGCMIGGAIAGGFLLIILILLGSFIGTYNNLQSLDENVNSNWAQVENQLQRRADLIPNLVNVVKGYASHEKSIFVSVAEARSKLSGAIQKHDVKGAAQANDQMTGALSRLLVIAENYPQLKADKVFIGLQDELAGTENRIAVARKDYNDSVMTLNQTIRTFPNNMIAGIAGINKREYFKAEESAKEAPKVTF
ncbi:MAG: LemA family protein [bacterium]